MLQDIASMPRAWKRATLFAFDLGLIPVAFFLALALRLGEFWPGQYIQAAQALIVLLMALAVPLALALGTHSIKLTTFDLRGVSVIFVGALGLTSAGTVANWALEPDVPRSAPLIFGLVFFLMSVGGRIAGYALLARLEASARPKLPVAIYGAGTAGVQLLYALHRSAEYRAVAMVDDNPALKGVIIAGVRVCHPDRLEPLVTSGRVRRVLLAMPSVPATQRQRILDRLAELPCEVQQLPAHPYLINEGDLTRTLRPVSPDSLLGRDKVDLDIPEVARAYAGRSVLVTGAGGSIGCELCRQILTCGPRRLVLFDISEYALYSVEREMRPLAAEAGVDLVARLGSVVDRGRVERVLAANAVEIVLHAAAYKHVPLIEANEIEGVQNNVFGTRTIAEASAAAGVERFILVSTDKAVRPANVMGATKRLAELVIRDLQTRVATTKFAMVRFGNVLGSSGSVIPLFREQIELGGPVTLTHPEVTRYFMTIPEASRLVLLAGAFASGGEVFVLDMGEPTRIRDLARRMIRLSGQTVRDEDNPDGDIEIRIVGLRPGEKLYEELLIDREGMLPTPHEKILCASERMVPAAEMAAILEDLADALLVRDRHAVRAVLEASLGPDRAAPLALWTPAAE